MSKPIIAIDASNIRAGGGVTHLSQLLAHADPEKHQFQHIVVWGGQGTLHTLPNQEWLKKRQVALLEKSLPWRMLWQQFLLPKALLEEKCQLLFSPGGILPRGLKIASLVMSQNMLPFEPEELERFSPYFWQKMKLKLIKHAQLSSVKRASAVLFLSKHARRTILQASKASITAYQIIPHGMEERFFQKPRPTAASLTETQKKPLKILYVSTIYPYKHQRLLVEAVSRLRQEGYQLSLTLVGSSLPGELEKLKKCMKHYDPEQKYIFYLGSYSYQKLHILYQEADLYLYPSTCENLPFSLLEAMASGLPIAASQKQPMPEVLQNGALYFDAEEIEELLDCLRLLLEQPLLRQQLANRAYHLAKAYSWEKTVQQTFTMMQQMIAEGEPEQKQSKCRIEEEWGDV